MPDQRVGNKKRVGSKEGNLATGNCYTQTGDWGVAALIAEIK